MRFKAICKEYDRTSAILLFENIRVQFRLIATDRRILTGALCLNYCERTSIIAEQHIISISFAGLVRHSGQLHFVYPVLALGPAGFFEHGIYVYLASLVL